MLKLINFKAPTLIDYGYAETISQPHITIGSILVDEADIDEGYTHYKLEGGRYVEDVDARVAYTTATAIAGFTSATTAYIQNEVNIYNMANGTAFQNVHNCESYSRDNNYNHQQFCLNVWNWNVTVWETVRTYQAGLTEIPTEEEFQAVLDSVPFA